MGDSQASPEKRPYAIPSFTGISEQDLKWTERISGFQTQTKQRLESISQRSTGQGSAGIFQLERGPCLRASIGKHCGKDTARRNVCPHPLPHEKLEAFLLPVGHHHPRFLGTRTSVRSEGQVNIHDPCTSNPFSG